MPPSPDSDWASFQTLFLDVLEREAEAGAIKTALLESTDAAELRGWIESMRPEMLETASMLVKQWGERGGDEA